MNDVFCHDNGLPHAIVHFDGDSFFASVEQARDYRLRGKPVVTGAERNIVAAMSYEAKKYGITRAMTIQEARRMCPHLIALHSDFELYSIYAKRMYAIAKRFTSDVEEYSIDECFADITHTKMFHGMSYENIARNMKQTLEGELGITFGVGLAPNKTLAKMASKWVKPAGFTVISNTDRDVFLHRVPVQKLWGVGGATASYMNKVGIKTALDFAQKDISWLRRHRFTKPLQEMWHELRGGFAKHIAVVPYNPIHSVISSRTFTPTSSDSDFIFSELSKNVEHACAKLRRHTMQAMAGSFYLKTADFSYVNYEVRFEAPIDSPIIIVDLFKKGFTKHFCPRDKYRATGVTLYNTQSAISEQDSLFDCFTERITQTEQCGLRDRAVFHVVDAINRRYKKRAVYLASSARSVTYRIKESAHVRHNTLELPMLGVAHC